MIENEDGSPKDNLDWEGEAFKFVLLKIVDLFHQALREAGIDECAAQDVLRRFNEALKDNEEIMRRNLASIEVDDVHDFEAHVVGLGGEGREVAAK